MEEEGSIKTPCPQASRTPAQDNSLKKEGQKTMVSIHALKGVTTPHTKKIEGENENKGIQEETDDRKMKDKVEQTYGNIMSDTCTMKGGFLTKVEIKKFNGTNAKTWLTQLE